MMQYINPSIEKDTMARQIKTSPRLSDEFEAT